MKYVRALAGFFYYLVFYRRINKKIFEGKSVAIVGSADSLFKEANGPYIDSFDIVIRVNKAIYTWKSENEIFTGTKTTMLFHSMYENSISGGGALDFQMFDRHKVDYVINPKNNFEGWRLTFNFYKKYLSTRSIYLMPSEYTRKCLSLFSSQIKPTIGFFALFAALTSRPKKIYISGFTFFKTPYLTGYRDHFLDMQANREHIVNQGIHNVEFEFKLFKQLLDRYNSEIEIELDKTLYQIISENFDSEK